MVDTVHHVVSRGVNRMRIFTSRAEKQQYLSRFCKVAGEEKVLVHGYCLMDNHVHWLLTPTTPTGLEHLFRRAHTWWALTFSRRHGRTGHLLEGRFHSSPLQEDHYWTALRYVELNPRRAHMIERPEDFEFSSARAHMTGVQDPRAPLTDVPVRQGFTPLQWREFLRRTDLARETALRRALPASRPCGDTEWIRGLEARFHRKLAWSPPGRPNASNYSTAV
jgi:putative transposase